MTTPTTEVRWVLGLLGVKHSLRTYLRAIALSIIRYFAPAPNKKKVLYIKCFIYYTRALKEGITDA